MDATPAQSHGSLDKSMAGRPLSSPGFVSLVSQRGQVTPTLSTLRIDSGPVKACKSVGNGDALPTTRLGKGPSVR